MLEERFYVDEKLAELRRDARPCHDAPQPPSPRQRGSYGEKVRVRLSSAIARIGRGRGDRWQKSPDAGRG